MQSVKRHVGHSFLNVLNEFTVYKCQQKGGVGEKVHISEVGQQGTEDQRS